MSGPFEDTKCPCVGHPNECWNHPHACPCPSPVNNERRERIATAALQGLMASVALAQSDKYLAAVAVEYADALIAELDRT